MKKTPWFDSKTKPVHIGVYEVEAIYVLYKYWDGKRWSCAAENPYIAYSYRNEPSIFQQSAWRGLKKNG